jgi:hypothetical protein
MDVYRPLRAILFVYEVIRFVVMIRVCTAFVPVEGSAANGAFPYLVYAVPNALFPLMALFLWLSLAHYKPYISLYTAGKIIAVVSVIGWCLFSFQTIPVMWEEAVMMSVGVTFILALGDVLSICGGFLIQNKLNRLERLVDTPIATLAAAPSETTDREPGGIS